MTIIQTKKIAIAYLLVLFLIIFTVIIIWRNDLIQNWFWRIIPILILIVLLILVYFAGRKKENNKKYLLINGLKIKADYVNLEVMPSLTNPVIGYHYLTVKALDPATGIEKQYNTEIVGLNSKPANDKIPRHFFVYVNPKDENDYYIDVSSLTG